LFSPAFSLCFLFFCPPFFCHSIQINQLRTAQKLSVRGREAGHLFLKNSVNFLFDFSDKEKEAEIADELEAQERHGLMIMKRRRTWLAAAGVGLAVLSGCQTYNAESNLTLPTAHYLGHVPQYMPPSPPYPLTKETKSLEDENARRLEENQRPLAP
jgi:hypothetical protein